MYICTTCGKPISPNAPICFNCGELWNQRWWNNRTVDGPSYGPSYGPVPMNAGCVWPILLAVFLFGGMFIACAGLIR